MRISVVTAVLNSADTIGDCLRSVAGQSHPDVEHVVVDGGSTDGTVDVIRGHERGIARWTSEPDGGIYDAINKGIGAATGEVVGCLNADDLYADEDVLERVAVAFESTGCDACYGDLVYVRRNDTSRVVRYWASGRYRRGGFRRGWMPPHPTLFVGRGVYDRFGLFDTSFRISADYELMLRLFERYRISAHYIPRVLVRMRLGGASNRSLRNIIRKSREDYLSWRANRLPASLFTIAAKNLRKIPQFFDDAGSCPRAADV